MQFFREIWLILSVSVRRAYLPEAFKLLSRHSEVLLNHSFIAAAIRAMCRGGMVLTGGTDLFIGLLPLAVS
jgi:hypothetical protein